MYRIPLYGYSDGKGWVCQEFMTGRLLWRNEGLGKGSLTCADGHLYLRSQGGKGALALIEATPASYFEASRFDQPGRSTESSCPILSSPAAGSIFGTRMFCCATT